MSAFTRTDKVHGHLHFDPPSQDENIVVLTQEAYNTVAPEESLLNLEELVRHKPRSSANVLRDLTPVEEPFDGNIEGNFFN